MKLEVSYQGGTRYDIVTGAHRVVTDQPVEDGGQDAGLSPVELFVGSLAGCVGYFVGRFCKRHDIPHEGLHVGAEWVMAENPHRVGQIILSIHLSHPLTAELKERLLKVAHGCTVHQSLTTAPAVDITLTPQNGAMGHQS
ncbi:MAG TPA: OsmC family protein [Nitrospira sp.]|nr:OsmC family protein [Nitrospira sp.]